MASDNERNALRDLAPPPGGVTRFEARLDRAGHASRVRVGTLVSGLAVSILALVVINFPEPPVDSPPRTSSVYDAPEFDRLLGRRMEQTDLSIAINDEAVPVSVLPSTDSNIRIYEVDRD